MDSFELNKIIGAVLGTLLLVMGVGLVAEAVYHPIEGTGPGYTLAEEQTEGHGAEMVEVAQVVEVSALPALLANASAEEGATVARRCVACHAFEAGAANKAGPGLYNVVGAKVGAHEGYTYSTAMAEFGAAGGQWTLENLDEFLLAPRSFLPGTKMAFAGIASDEDRADLILFMRAQSDAPVPLPVPDVAQAEVPAAGAPATQPAQAPLMDNAVQPAATPQSGAADEEAALAARVAAASVEDGQAIARRCASCHTFDQGGANRIGPNMFNTVGARVAGHEGYNYSPAMAALGETGATWTLSNLDGFLEAPRTHLPGTKMSFPGIASEEDRADLLAYLQTLTDQPATPAAPAAPAEQPAAPVAPAAAPATPAAPVEQPLQPAGEAAPAGEASGLASMVANASIEDGQSVARRCASCHTFDEGGANRIGPNLFNSVGAQIAGHAGYNYSPALAAMGASGTQWTLENLDAFITAPRQYAPGTKMSFAGIASEEDRVNLLAYMQSLSAGAAQPAR